MGLVFFVVCSVVLKNSGCVCFDALRAGAPIDHLRLIDLEAAIRAGGQAWGVADGAVDIDRFPAAAADEVVVIVAGPVLVTGRGTGRLDAADQPFFRKKADGIVDRLPGNRPDFRPDIHGDLVRRGVWPTRHRPQHS